MEQRLRRANGTCSPDWIHPRLIVVITAEGEESADRLKILGWHSVLVMIPETSRGPNAITKCKQATVMTAGLKWPRGYGKVQLWWLVLRDGSGGGGRLVGKRQFTGKGLILSYFDALILGHQPEPPSPKSRNSSGFEGATWQEGLQHSSQYPTGPSIRAAPPREEVKWSGRRSGQNGVRSGGDGAIER